MLGTGYVASKLSRRCRGRRADVRLGVSLLSSFNTSGVRLLVWFERERPNARLNIGSYAYRDASLCLTGFVHCPRR